MPGQTPKPFSGIRAKVLVCLLAVLAAFTAIGVAGGVARSHSQGLDDASHQAAVLADQMEAVWDYLEGHQNIVAGSQEALSQALEEAGLNADALAIGDAPAPSANGYVCIISVKQVASRFSNAGDVEIRYTSLRPRNTLDAPDDFERAAMEAFQRDAALAAYGATDRTAEGERYRHLRPIHIKRSCLTCHGAPEGELDWLGYPKEGYALGDLVGAISISEPMERYYRASWDGLADWLLLFLGGMLVASAAVFAVLNAVVLRPVATMQRAARAYREGDLAHRVPEPRGDDEVAGLARDFNAMAGELQDLHAGLEQRVSERTAELERMNAALSDMLTDQQQSLDLAVSRLREEREAMARRALEPVRVGDFTFDQAKYAVFKRGEAVSLTPKEFSILFALASRAGEVVSQRELVQAAWGEGYTEEMAGVAVYVRRIRKKVEDDPAHPRHLKTAWGEGYLFEA